VTNQSTPLSILRVGVDSLSGQLHQDGTLHDPVFGAPTQYGSAYYAWCCAVLAGRLEDGEGYRDRAAGLLSEAIDHTADPERQPYASGFDRQTLSITDRLNHRDFTWPPILKTYLALGERAERGGFRKRLAEVDVEASFLSRPPSNWASVWLSGEWLRMATGLSSTSSDELDAWIDAFFEVGDAGFDLDLGMYLERGNPNAYDLFTRAHFTDLLLQGYAGRNRDRLESFLTTGLRRSLNLQLSDGSLASGYRSAGQTWVLSAQIALFTASRTLRLGSSADQEGAWLGAWRAFGSLARWQRPDGYFSPVQNLLAPELRVGYEAYTADGHYSPLALGFLASAVYAGFGDDDPPSGGELDGRPAATLAEGAPTHRGAVHLGRLSIGVHAEADDSYDATGLVDITFGSGRQLHFVSAARHLSGGPWLVPGLALRDGLGAQPVIAVGALRHNVSSRLARLGTAGLQFETTMSDSDRAARRYRWQGSVADSGAELVETVPGWPGWLTLLVPYLRDLGSAATTVVSLLDSGVRFALGDEWVEFAVEGEIERGIDLPYGYESRRGLCGLVRLDLTEPGETLRWSVVSSD
jgi:hypothetical protein